MPKSNPSRLVVIDGSNLHKGGGVQVGASIINELGTLLRHSDPSSHIDAIRIDAVISHEIAKNVHNGIESDRLRLSVSDSRPMRWTSFPEKSYDVALTVFGPPYRRRRARREICGFAIPRMIIPWQDVGLERPARLIRALDRVRWKRFESADLLVVESESAARALHRRDPSLSLAVIPNAVNGQVICSTARKQPQRRSLTGDEIVIAAVGRDYQHKNWEFLSRLGPSLAHSTGKRIRFQTTLSEEEWSAKSATFKEYADNWGVLRQHDLPKLYERCHFAVLPSLLEVSSATPLECMAQSIPIFVSDLYFMSEMYGDAVGYIDPSNAEVAARVISEQLTDDQLKKMARRGGEWLAAQPTARDRARAYLDLLLQPPPTEARAYVRTPKAF